MGSGMRPFGRIKIEPPLSGLQIKELKALGGAKTIRDIKLQVREVDQPDGSVMRTGVALKPDVDEISWDFKEQVQVIMDRFPEHAFIGHFEMTGYEPGDPPWRLVVGSDRKLHEIQPQQRWPDVP